MLYIVQYRDRYDNNIFVGAFTSKEKALEAVYAVYEEEDTEPPKSNGVLEDYYVEDWFNIEVTTAETDLIYI